MDYQKAMTGDESNLNSNALSFFEFANIILRRRMLFVVVFFLIFLFGIYYMVINVPVYKYYQTICLSHYFKNTDNNAELRVTPLQQIDNVVFQIEHIYLPQSLKKINASVQKKERLNIKNIHVLFDANRPLFIRLIVFSPVTQKAVDEQLFSLILKDINNNENDAIILNAKLFNNKISALKRLNSLTIQEKTQSTALLKMLHMRLKSNNKLTNGGVVASNSASLGKSQVSLMQYQLLQLIENKSSDNYISLLSGVRSLSDSLYTSEVRIAQQSVSLSSLVKSKFISSLIKDEQPINPSRLMIILVFFISSIVIALFAVFLAEVFSKRKNTDDFEN